MQWKVLIADDEPKIRRGLHVQIERMGLQAQMHAFPDHHVFRPSDLAFADTDTLLMTEKDAVKCTAFAPPDTWVLPVEAQLDPDLAKWVVEKLNGPQPA